MLNEKLVSRMRKRRSVVNEREHPLSIKIISIWLWTKVFLLGLFWSFPCSLSHCRLNEGKKTKSRSKYKRSKTRRSTRFFFLINPSICSSSVFIFIAQLCKIEEFLIALDGRSNSINKQTRRFKAVLSSREENDAEKNLVSIKWLFSRTEKNISMIVDKISMIEWREKRRETEKTDSLVFSSFSLFLFSVKEKERNKFPSSRRFRRFFVFYWRKRKSSAQLQMKLSFFSSEMIAVRTVIRRSSSNSWESFCRFVETFERRVEISVRWKFIGDEFFDEIQRNNFLTGKTLSIKRRIS